LLPQQPPYSAPPSKDCDLLVLGSPRTLKSCSVPVSGSITCFGREISSDNKLLGIDAGLADQFYEKNKFDFILVEGDGSKQKPVKAPAVHEPVIPESVTKLVGVVGLDSLGTRISVETVHRPEIFCKITGAVEGDKINEEMLSRLIISPDGLFKSTPNKCRRYLLLDKADSPWLKDSARHIIDLVKNIGPLINGSVIASMTKGLITRHD